MKLLSAAICLTLCAALPAGAEVFVLSSGGRVEGELLNPKELPREKYVIRIADGATLTLPAKQVSEVLHPRPEEIEYQRIQPTFPDTVAGQWALAQWCLEHKLRPQRETHLRRVIELDPNHVEARRGLGYSQVDGQWVTRDEVMQQRGYVRYKGQWKLPQEVELLEGKRQLEAAQQEWFQNIKRWRGWLGTDRDQQARQNIRDIRDPQAVRALAIGLRDESDPRVRMLYAAALAKIEAPEAAQALAIAAVYDPEEEVRLSCLDYLEGRKLPDVTAYFVGKLKDKDNVIVNRAAVGLGRMKDPTSVGPLIAALVTSHRFKIIQPGGDSGMGAGFDSRGGMGLSVGNKPKYVRRMIPNQSVLDALVALTGKNFNFDQQAWKYWHAGQKKSPDKLDARRD
jgi:hypothetical protein